jgi:phosphosulfolactate synthase
MSLTATYLDRIGTARLPARTSVFDPGYDPVTLRSHLEQSRDLISILKLSMACWLVAEQSATEDKIAAAKANGVPVTTGGGPFEVAVGQGALPEYLDLCSAMGLDRIECGEGFTDLAKAPEELVAMAGERGLEVQFELGKKHDGAFGADALPALLRQGADWLEAGAVELVIEARESARGVGLFDEQGQLNQSFARAFADSFGLDKVTFEAPDKASQFALLDLFGPHVRLGNVRLEELLRVEIYRRGLHSDAYDRPHLRPRAPSIAGSTGPSV